MLSHKWFKEVGTQIREAYRTHVFTEGLDVNDKSFKPYTSETYEQRKKAGKFKRFTKGDKLTSPVLTGDLLRDYSLIKTSSTGFQIGWTTFGARVEHLRNYGRVLTTSDKPLPTKVFKYLTTEACKYIKKETKKLIPCKTKKHKIG